jgi:hypothetical protein
MKIKVDIEGSLARPSFGPVVNRIRQVVQSAATVQQLEQELADELQIVSESEHAVDPDARRDALERAVRRTWGATQ